jgi:hypothetical protein
MKRDKLPTLIQTEHPIGVELGVASGRFSHELIKFKFKKFFCIDKWNDRHDIREYYDALHRLNRENTFVIRSTFEEAIDLFEDEYFDFIYIDGYAHKGQKNIETLFSWFKKLKSSGIYSGHDYNKEKWSDNVKCINAFLEKINKKPKFTEEEWASWWIRK